MKSVQYFFSSPFGNQSLLPVSFTIEPFDGACTFLPPFLSSGNGFVRFGAFNASCFFDNSGQNVLKDEGGYANRFCGDEVARHNCNWSIKTDCMMTAIFISS